MTDTQTIVWIATGILVLVGAVALVTRAINSGKKLPMPESKPYDTQDAPPSDKK